MPPWGPQHWDELLSIPGCQSFWIQMIMRSHLPLHHFWAVKIPGCILQLAPPWLVVKVTFMLGNGNHVKNPNLRGKAGIPFKVMAHVMVRIKFSGRFCGSTG